MSLLTSSTTHLDVLIVEPDEYRGQRHALDLMHDPEHYAVGCLARSKREAMAYLSRHQPQACIVNVKLPDGNGCDVIRSVLKKNPQALILVVSEVQEETGVMQAVSAGADGYVLFSDTPSMNMATCLDLLLSGGSPVSPLIARCVLRALHCRTTSELHDPVIGPLSSRELEIMRLLAKGLTFTEIGSILTISANTVTTHIKKIYRKLHVHSRGEAVYEARQLHLID